MGDPVRPRHHPRLLVLAGAVRTGRYIYAIGANPEAARRAGINVARIRTFGFIMAAVTAGLAGLVYESRQGSISTDIDGGNLVLFAVAAAVIGGTSLFGGRGKMMHALLGGFVIAAVFNGLALMGISAAGQDIATAIVLIAAVTLDSLVRRRATARQAAGRCATVRRGGARWRERSGRPRPPALPGTMTGMSDEARRAAAEKMRGAGAHEEAIRAFESAYRRLDSGAARRCSRAAELEPARRRAGAGAAAGRRRRRGARRGGGDQAQRRPGHDDGAAGAQVADRGPRRALVPGHHHRPDAGAARALRRARCRWC